MIVIGPGSLYTSILPNLLVPELGREVCNARAKKVYICNLMTQAGETLHYTASDHVRAVHEHLGGACIDTILVNNEEVPSQIKLRYKEELAQPVHFDIANLLDFGLEVVQEQIMTFEDKYIRHDTKKVANILYQMLINETKTLYGS